MDDGWEMAVCLDICWWEYSDGMTEIIARKDRTLELQLMSALEGRLILLLRLDVQSKPVLKILKSSMRGWQGLARKQITEWIGVDP
jgi:hypothetical protein